MRGISASNHSVEISEFLGACRAAGAVVYECDIAANGPEGPAALLLSHEMSLTGAPIALLTLACAMQGMGYMPIVVSPCDGPLCEEFAVHGIAVVVCPAKALLMLALTHARSFALVVANTLVMADVVGVLNGTSVPVLWWVHEAEGAYKRRNTFLLPQTLHPNVMVAAAGERARQSLLRCRPQYDVRELLYGVEDMARLQMGEGLSNVGDGLVDCGVCQAGKAATTTFALVGTICTRKGQDLLLDAIGQLEPELARCCEFLLVGEEVDRGYATVVRRRVAGILNVSLMGQLRREDMASLYERIDCLVCTSRDDPMPVVVAEACQFGKVVICSENTGSAALLKQYQAGMVYENDDPAALAACMRRACAEETGELAFMRRNARRLYEERFSEEALLSSLSAVLEELLGWETVPCDEEDAHAARTRNRASRLAALHWSVKCSMCYRVARACYRAAGVVGSLVATVPEVILGASHRRRGASGRGERGR